MTEPFRMPPLDKGTPVGLDTIVSDGDRSQGEAIADLLTAYPSRADLVLVAVPAGEGVILEHWLRGVLGVESPPAAPLGRNQRREETP